MRHYLAVGLVLSLACMQLALAEPGKLTVDLTHPGPKISPMLYGLMTEEINHSYDGGLYAELIQNRTFKDSTRSALHWSALKVGDAQADIALDTEKPVNANALSTSLRLDITKAGERAGIINDGYWGIPATPNTPYKASFYAKAKSGFTGPLTVDIETNDGSKILATASVPAITTEWKKYEVVLNTQDLQPSTGNRFVISATNPGTVWFSLVSLFPPTYNDRANGNRIDLMKLLADMHTTFLRLPGGNYLEGNTIADRFDWEKTLGDLENRPGHQGPWRYRSSDGLGLYEFFMWCEDLKIKPVLAVFAGYALRGQHIDAGPALLPYVHEALDEIEYAIGDPSTKWGKERAKNGHPAPFDVQYVEIGNEDWFDRSGSYNARFAQFYDAIKAKYPQLLLIATTPVKSRTADVLDDHYYRSARSMERDVHHYDKSERGATKIFVGEWATEEGTPTPTLNAALGDAAWMTGMERNSDLIVMSCYAPLLVNVNRGAWQWPTNLIGYDALNSFGSPSYYAQKMFYENRGDTVLPLEVVATPIDPSLAPPPRGAIGVGTWTTTSEYKDIKVTSGDKVLYQSNFAKGADDWRVRGGTWHVQDGAFRQTSDLENARATTGDAAWTDYTYTLKARKISGTEGFLICFHVENRNTFSWWNVGGWNNTRTALERTTDGGKEEFGEAQEVTVEPNRWYDIKIELKGQDVKCYLDGKLITHAVENAVLPEPLIATASRLDTGGEVILKVVNPFPVAQPMQINLKGAASVEKKALVQLLTGNPSDVNTLAEPRKIFPQQVDINDAGMTFMHEFPANSITVMTLGAH